MSNTRAPVNRAEVVTLIAEAIAGGPQYSVEVVASWLSDAEEVLAALEAAGVRLVPAEPLERQLVGGMIRPDYYRAVAASPYAPDGV